MRKPLQELKRMTTWAVGAAMLLGVFLAPAVASAKDAGQEAEQQPLIHYSFDSASDGSTISNEGSASGSDATVTGSASVSDGSLSLTGSQYVTVPTAVIQGRQNLTVSMWLKNNYGSGNVAAAYIGNAATKNGYFLLNPSNPKGYVKAVMTTATSASPNSSPWGTETGPGSTNAATSGTLATADLALYTTVIDGTDGTMSFYLNGRQVGDSPYSIPEGGLTNYGDLVAYVGKSAYSDPNTKMNVDDYAIYGEAMDSSDVQKLYADQVFDKAVSSIDLPTSATEDFALPISVVGVPIQWTSDNSAITVDGDKAIVTRPAADGNDASVTLTATFTIEGAKKTSSYKVTVPRALTDAEYVENALQSISITNASDMRGSFSVPTVADNGATIDWSVVGSGSVSASVGTGVNASSSTVTVTRPAAGKSAATVVLKATVRYGDSSQDKEFKVVVQPMPSDKSSDQAYVWAFFTGEGVGGEKISLAASKGNNALDWNTLNNGTPLFTSTEGEQGLRDPFILKSKDGDKFYMLATDLKISGRSNSVGGLSGFAGAQADGSTYIEIWESDDLVNWSKQRHVKVSSDYAGNTWAPEAYWDEEIGKYVVYWASNLYSTTNTADRTSMTYNRMMYVTTNDFINFSKPTIWIDSQRGSGTDGKGSIDATVQKVGNTYYRVYKDENSMTLREEKSTDLLATVSGSYPTTGLASNQWSLVGEKIGNGQPNGYGGTFSAGEGPSLFKANVGDVNGYQYYLFADQPNYHGGPNHYVPMATTDISDASKWKVIGDEMPETNFPTNSDGGKPRHGTVLPVTRAQYQKVLEAYAPNIAVTSVESVDLASKVGVNPQYRLPQSIKLTKADGSTVSAKVSWDDIDPLKYQKTGTITVSGTANDASKMPVEATIRIVGDDVTLKTMNIAGTDINLTSLAAGTASLSVSDPAAITTRDVTVVTSDSNATTKIEVINDVVRVVVTSSDGSRQATYTVRIVASNEKGSDENAADGSADAASSDREASSSSTFHKPGGHLASTGAGVLSGVVLVALFMIIGMTLICSQSTKRL